MCSDWPFKRRVNDAESYSMHWHWKGYYHTCWVRADLQIYKPSSPIVTMVQRNPAITLIWLLSHKLPLIARFMGPTWGPSGADRTQVGPMLSPWTLLSGTLLLCREFVCVEHKWLYSLTECQFPLLWVIPLQQTSLDIHLMIDRHYWYNLYRLTW